MTMIIVLLLRDHLLVMMIPLHLRRRHQVIAVDHLAATTQVRQALVIIRLRQVIVGVVFHLTRENALLKQWSQSGDYDVKFVPEGPSYYVE